MHSVYAIKALPYSYISMPYKSAFLFYIIIIIKYFCKSIDFINICTYFSDFAILPFISESYFQPVQHFLLKIKQRNLIRLRYIPEDMQIIHKINHTLADLRPLSEIIF